MRIAFTASVGLVFVFVKFRELTLSTMAAQLKNEVLSSLSVMATFILRHRRATDQDAHTMQINLRTGALYLHTQPCVLTQS